MFLTHFSSKFKRIPNGTPILWVSAVILICFYRMRPFGVVPGPLVLVSRAIFSKPSRVIAKASKVTTRPSLLSAYGKPAAALA